MNFSILRQQVNKAVVTIEFVLIIGTLILAAPHLQAQETETKPTESKTTQDLPSGEDVMAKHIAKTGGQQAYDKIKNRVSESTMEIVGQNVSLDITTYAARPNKTLVKIDSELTGKIEKGSDGKVIWENSLISGPVIHEGVQRSMGLRDSTFERFVHWKTIYDSAECVGVKMVGDSECYEVLLQPKKFDPADEDESPVHLFLDTSSYLIHKLQTVIDSEVGKIDVVAYPEDYRTVDGIMISHKVRMELLGQKREVIVKSTKHNVKLPENFFDLPDEVRKLVK